MVEDSREALFLTDSGLETTLVFHDGMELPCFASFPLLDNAEGRARLEHYYARHAAIARAAGMGFVFEAPTWRASADWGATLGYDATALERVNREAAAMMVRLRDAYRAETGLPALASGNVGPRGDGYVAEARMNAAEAEAYHAAQMRSFAAAGADLGSAFTINYVEEGVGTVRAAKAAGLGAVLSFTLETDGRLPSGEALGEAIARTDAESEGGPVWYMINCAHPDHFREVLERGGAWRERIGGLRANASRLSHAELDACETLDDGDPAELGAQYAELRRLLPRLRVIGGCCGTDHRHVERIAAACAEPVAA